MPTFARSQVLGHLGADAELTRDRNADVVTFRLAADGRRSHGRTKRTTWFHVEYRSRHAARLAERLAKGTLVWVEGEVGLDEWTDRDGIRHARIEVRATEVVPVARPAKATTSPAAPETRRLNAAGTNYPL